MSEQNEAKLFEEPADFGRPIITNGRMFSFPLRSSIRKSSISPGNCVSIVWDGVNSAFYGLVMGPEPQLFIFDSNSTVEEIGVIDHTRAETGFLVFDEADRLLCCLVLPNGDSHLFVHSVVRGRRMYSHMWGHFAWSPIEPMGIVFKNDRVVAGLSDPDTGIYLATEGGALHHVDLETGKYERVATLPDKNLSSVLVCDVSADNLYGVSGKGEFWHWDGSEVSILGARVPTMKNRDYAASCSALVHHAGKIYGSTYQDAYLFEFDPVTEVVKNLGRADENSEIRGFDILPDGRIFGITSTPGVGMGHLFCYSQIRGFVDIGVIQGWQPIFDFAYEPRCICAGGSGDFLIGNGEGRSNVFLYCSAPER